MVTWPDFGRIKAEIREERDVIDAVNVNDDAAEVSNDTENVLAIDANDVENAEYE